MIFLSIATNTSIYPVLLLLPLLLVIRTNTGATTRRLCGFASAFIMSEIAMMLVSTSIFGGQSLKRSWGLM